MRAKEAARAAGTASRARQGYLAVLVTVALVASACTSSTAPANPPRTTANAPTSAQPWPRSFASSLLTGVTSVDALSCATAADCSAVAVGTTGRTPGAGATTTTTTATSVGPVLLTTTDGGGRWTRSAAPSPISFLSDLSCPTTWCVAGGQELTGSGPTGVFVVRAGPTATWSTVGAPGGVTDVTTLTCLADQWCLAVGTSAFGPLALVSTDAGRSWALQGPLRNGAMSATSVSCTSPTACWAATYESSQPDHATGTVLATSDGGATWVPTTALPSGTGIVSAVACTPATSPPPGTPAAGGVGAGAGTSASSTTGSSTTTTVPATSPAVPDGNCVVAGTTGTTFGDPRVGSAVLLTSSDGGASWTPQAIGSSIASLTSVSCPTSSACVAAGSTTATTPQAGVLVLTGGDGQPWASARTQLVPEAPVALSCPALGHCLGAGGPVLERLG
ncbi:MAG: hypothetical protein M0032_07535 [Actinomycetota bacterium]|nr:hypothetical protein [Actinomycetota bacterium]